MYDSLSDVMWRIRAGAAKDVSKQISLVEKDTMYGGSALRGCPRNDNETREREKENGHKYE